MMYNMNVVVCMWYEGMSMEKIMYALWYAYKYYICIATICMNVYLL